MAGFPVTGKEQGISSENGREAKTRGDFPPLNQWLVEESLRAGTGN
jgi:hypothetical protein